MGNASSHLHSWFNKSNDAPSPPFPVFPPKTIFVIHNEELGLCQPQQIAFKMPAAPPVMHYAENDDELSPKINKTGEVPRNFWPNREDGTIEVGIVNENPKELVRQGHKHKHLTLHLMRYTPRAMIPTMKLRLTKLYHITDYVITFMLYSERADIGKIEKQDKNGFPTAVLFYCNVYKVLPEQVMIYINLLLNPDLIRLQPAEFDEYVKACAQAQTRAEEFSHKPIDIPLEIPQPQGGLLVEKKGTDELRIFGQPHLGWTPMDWVGIFRPYAAEVNQYIAKFPVTGRIETFADVKMYPIPYGEIVIRYVREENSVASSELLHFGDPIKLAVTKTDGLLRVAVSGDLPKLWSVSVVNKEGREVARARPEGGTSTVNFPGLENWKELVQVRVIADLWSDCLFLRDL